MAHRIFRLLCAMIVLLGTAGMEVAGDLETFSEEQLKAMKDEELERICLDRGFEILRDEIDPSTGLPHELTHDDFVEAATRCLEIEREM